MNCPKCKSDRVARILHGDYEITKELQEEIDEGKIILGECVTDEKSPFWHCNKCTYEFTNKELNDIVKSIINELKKKK